MSPSLWSSKRGESNEHPHIDWQHPSPLACAAAVSSRAPHGCMTRPSSTPRPAPGEENSNRPQYIPPPVEEVVASIKKEKPAVVFAPHVETSTGILLPDSYIKVLPLPSCQTHEPRGAEDSGTPSSFAPISHAAAITMEAMMPCPRGYSTLMTPAVLPTALQAISAAAHSVGALFVLDGVASGMLWVDMEGPRPRRLHHGPSEGLDLSCVRRCHHPQPRR